MSINRVMISGNLTRDAELRTTPSGTAILNFGVAVNDRRRNQNGEWEDYANFVDCTMFGRRAEALQNYLKKGLKVAIEGRLHYSTWEDRNSGQKRSKLDVTVDELEFMSSRGEGGNYGGQQQSDYGASQQSGNYGGSYGGQSYDAGQAAYDASSQRSQVPNMPEAQPPSAYDDEDIPF